MTHEDDDALEQSGSRRRIPDKMVITIALALLGASGAFVGWLGNKCADHGEQLAKHDERFDSQSKRMDRIQQDDREQAERCVKTHATIDAMQGKLDAIPDGHELSSCAGTVSGLLARVNALGDDVRELRSELHAIRLSYGLPPRAAPQAIQRP